MPANAKYELFHAHDDDDAAGILARFFSAYKMFAYITLNVMINHNHYVVVSPEEGEPYSLHAATWKRATLANHYTPRRPEMDADALYETQETEPDSNYIYGCWREG